MLPKHAKPRGWEPIGLTLLEITCGAGQGDCFRFLTEFCRLNVAPETMPEVMRQALAGRSEEIVRDVWNRLEETEREQGLVSFAHFAAELHNEVVFAVLGASRRPTGLMRSRSSSLIVTWLSLS
jgi:hypothetical protein